MNDNCIGCGRPIRFWQSKRFIEHESGGTDSYNKLRIRVESGDNMGPFHKGCAHAFKHGYNHRFPVP